MSFIGAVGFRRDGGGGGDGGYRQIGKLWYVKEDHRCSILLNGWRYGLWQCVPYGGIYTPYICGDIIATLGTDDDKPIPQKTRVWCGFMWSTDDEKGTRYSGILEVMPFIEPNPKGGIWLSVHMNDHEPVRNKAVAEKEDAAPAPVDDDPLPF